LARAIGIDGEVKAAKTLMYLYAGLALGDVMSGLACQWLGSRRKVMLLFIIALTSLSLAYLFAMNGVSLKAFYTLCGFLGMAAGYWAVFVTNAAEQFGSNLRATVATTVPNFVRGAVVPMTLSFEALRGGMGPVAAASTVGGVTLVLALVALWAMPDHFSSELDYTEELC
jgi:MFS transporter, putative metabolite:H+ symporter